VVVGYPVFPEAIPGTGIVSLEVAGKFPVPEFDVVQVGTIRILAPDHTHIGDVDMVIPQAVQAVVAIMVCVGNNQAMQVILVTRFDTVVGPVIRNRKGLRADGTLYRRFQQGRCNRHVCGEIVALPAGCQQQYQAGVKNQFIDRLQRV